jgi:hypothetical protein
MKIILILIFVASFAWSFSRQEQQPETGVVLAYQQNQSLAQCPGVKSVETHSSDSWNYMGGNEKTPDLLLRDYHRRGHNDFGIIRTM